MNEIQEYFLENCIDFGRGEYSKQQIAQHLTEYYPKEEIVKQYHNLTHPKKVTMKQLISIAGIIIGILLIAGALLSQSNASEITYYNITYFGVDQPIIQTNLSACNFLREDVGQNITIQVNYTIENKTISKAMQREVKAIIGEEFCIDEASKSGCGIIPISFIDKYGVKRVALTIKGQTILNFDPNTQWTIAQNIENGILFDTSFLLPNKSLSEINEITIQDYENENNN